MDALQALTTRRTASKLTDPEPPPEVLEACLEAAIRAPDHGRLRPWRFILIRGEGRQRLGRVMAKALAARDAAATEAMVERERTKPLRAPLIVVAVAKVEPDHEKIPEIEQVLAAGAAAQNFLIALHAAGFGAMWRTGSPAYDATVKAALGLAADDHIIGFLYVGTIEVGPGPAAEQNLQDFVSDWA